MWEFMQKLNQEGTTIILTTHYLEEAEQLCRNIAIIDQGKIIQSTSMRKLLSQLNTEVFILDLTKALPSNFSLTNFHFQTIAEDGLEVSIEKGQSLNQVFTQLSAQQVEVRSMRTKSNRLEELFVNLVHGEKA
jgi:ABC-2 type transport system ATP-binding protein